MAKDFAYCLADLAAMLSVDGITDLPANEAAQVRAVLNDAYRECFLRPDGSRSRWSERSHALLFKSPAQFTATMTEGETTLIASISIPAGAVGSVLCINGHWMTLAASGNTLEPWPYASGVYPGMLYHVANVLPSGFLEAVDDPHVLGGEVLESRQEILDAMPDAAALGEPTFYAIDSSVIGGTTSPRFVIYPMPQVSCTVKFKASFVPDNIGDDLTQVPAIPLAAVDDILLPIARMKLVMVAKRYSGANKIDVVAAGREAQRKLDSITLSTRGRTLSVAVRDGY